MKSKYHSVLVVGLILIISCKKEKDIDVNDDINSAII